MELEKIYGVMVRILEIAAECMDYEEMPDHARRALKEAAPMPLLDNVWRMMLHGGLFELDAGDCPRITLDGLEWLYRRKHPEK